MKFQNGLRTNCKIIVLIFFLSLLLLSFKPLWAENETNRFSNKIGPFLRKSITETKNDSSKLLKQGVVEKNELIKVIVVMDYDHLAQLSEEIIDQLKDRVEQLGGYIGDHAFNNVQVWIPIGKIEKLAEWSEIRLIKKPFRIEINSITSEGVNVIGANNLHNGGWTGEGIKIGIIDLGFKGYDSLLGTELPISVATHIMGSYSDFISDVHGTACTEIVHDVAPDAELYLVNVNDIDVGFHNAVSWLKSQNVNVISSSIGINLKIYCALLYEALRDPTASSDYISSQINFYENAADQWDSTINSAVSQGITWSQAAGNDGRRKWEGFFNDSDGDYYLNFSAYENHNEIELPSYFSYGGDVYVILFWGFDTDLLTSDDFDLNITDEFGFIIDSSTFEQAQLPIGMEACKFTPIPGEKYYINVLQYWAVPQDVLLLIGIDKLANLKHYSSSNTVNLLPPAHNPNVITVGAVPYNNPYNIEPYSSQGPNEDGIIKPDLVAPDYVSTVSYGVTSFPGTSAAAPHVAGACALVKQIYPAWSPNQIKNYLESNAIDLGSPGKDNTYGSGLVTLPASSTPHSPPAGSANINGKVLYNGLPVCAMVLANGQYMFSCSGDGSYSLDVPLDDNGLITLFAFVDGLAPFKRTLTPSEAANFDVQMEPASPDSKTPTVTRIAPVPVVDPSGWVKISGSVYSGATPLCAMVLANGQYMFSCGDKLPVGNYELVVPLDSSGMITLFVFVDGLQPYKEIISFNDDQTPYNQEQTERLIGKWYFTYTIISQFDDTYTLPGPAVESTSTPGVYNLFGYDTYMNDDVVAGYSPSSDSFTLLDAGITIDNFFVFDFIGSNTVSGCYYLVHKDSGELSDCYPMTGSKIGTADIMNSLENMSTLTSIATEEKESQLIEEVRAHNLAKSSLEKTATISKVTERRVHVIEEIESLRQELERNSQGK